MKEHYLALKALLEEQRVLAGRVHLGVRVTGGQPVRDNYVVVRPSAPTLDDNRYLATQRPDSKANYRFDVSAVATSGEWLLEMNTAVMQIVGQKPSVPGRDCDPIALVPAVEEGQMGYDSVTDLHYIHMSFDVVSRRA